MKRILAICVAVMLWLLSMKFSIAGFGADISNRAEDAWIGWTLALTVTAFELIWNSMKDRTNLTMYAVGGLCYTYGIVTNILGVMVWRGMTLDATFNAFNSGDPTKIVGMILSVGFVLCMALVVEISPEPVFVYGLTGNYDGGDFLGNLFGNKVPLAPEHKSWGSGNGNSNRGGNQNSQSGNGNPQKYVPSQKGGNGNQVRPVNVNFSKSDKGPQKIQDSRDNRHVIPDSEINKSQYDSMRNSGDLENPDQYR